MCVCVILLFPQVKFVWMMMVTGERGEVYQASVVNHIHTPTKHSISYAHNFANLKYIFFFLDIHSRYLSIITIN